jgi:hypothetical protein
MTGLPWLPINMAPDDGRAVFVWTGEDYRWASWRVPVFHPDPEHEGEVRCEDRLPMSPPPTHWLPLSPPDDGAPWPDGWAVTAHCSCRGPGDSLACYTLVLREGSRKVFDETAQAVAQSMVHQLVSEVFQKLRNAVQSTEGADPDKTRPDQLPDS